MTSQQAEYTEPQRNLLRSVVKNDKSRVEELLEEYEWSPEDLGRILWHALRLGTFEAVHMLIEAGADVNTPNAYVQDGYDNRIKILTNLVHNNKPGCYDFALLMMEHLTIRVNIRSHIADCLLHCAIADPSIAIDVIEKLFAFRATTSGSDFRCIIDETTRADVIEKLIDLRVRVEVLTPAIFIRADADTIVPMLLQRDLLDDERGRVRAAEMLRRCINLADKEQALVVAKKILDLKFPACDLDTSFTLCSAIERNHPKLVQLLLEYGFNVNKPGKGGLLPLYVAAKSQQSTITKLLIEAGAQVNAFSTITKNRNAGCAIHNACRNASTENIQVLLDHGAAIDLIDEWGSTPFSLIAHVFHNGMMNGAHVIVIKHLAVLVSKGKHIQNSDLLTIESHRIMHTYYNQCMSELESMKTCNIINDIPFFSIFREDTKKLLFVTRKYNFVENVLCEDEFPIFYEEMNLLFKNAKKQKELLRNKEEALYDSLENILPDVPMQKIICYLYFNSIDN